MQGHKEDRINTKQGKGQPPSPIQRKEIMKWTKKTRTIRFTVLNNKLFPIIDTIYVSDYGHVILKDHTSGYWYGNHWFNQLKDAKIFVEREG